MRILAFSLVVAILTVTPALAANEQALKVLGCDRWQETASGNLCITLNHDGEAAALSLSRSFEDPAVCTAASQAQKASATRAHVRAVYAALSWASIPVVGLAAAAKSISDYNLYRRSLDAGNYTCAQRLASFGR